MLQLALMVVGAALLGALLLYLDGRRRDRAIGRDWELLLTQKGSRALEHVEGQLHAHTEAVDVAIAGAREAQQKGSIEEARQFLDVGTRMIELYCPTAIRALRAMAVLSRMAMAIAPIQPVPRQKLRLPQLARLAAMNQLIHQFLVTTAERFRLRAYILARAFQLLGRLAVGSFTRVKARPDARREWEALDAAHSDMHVLTEESLETFRVLLVSLSAERRATSP